MSTVHHLVSASLAGMFAAALLIASHTFGEYCAKKQPAFQPISVTRPAL